MFYEDKQVTNEELYYLKNTMGIPVCKLAEQFKYIDDFGNMVEYSTKTRSKIKSFINNRIKAWGDRNGTK